MTNSTFDFSILEAINNAIKTVKASPLFLGGISSSGGGIGGPPGGFVGQLPQSRVTYDLLEAATNSTAVSGSLLDNLNHIRYRISGLETVISGGIQGSINVYDDGVLVASGITILDFGNNLTVSDLGAGHVLINAASGVGSGGASAFTDLTDVPTSYTGQANKYVAVNATEDGLTFTTISGTVLSGYVEVHDDFTSLTNGVINAFSSTYTILSGSSSVYYNGVRQRRTTNYDEVSSGIILNFVPATSETVLLDYMTPSSGINGFLLANTTGGGHTIQDEGTGLTQRTNLNFIGSTVYATDDAANDRTNITVSGLYSTAGKYSPTLTPGFYIDSVSNSADFMYMRVGNFVTVYGNLIIDPQYADDNVSVTMSLPISTSFTSIHDASGLTLVSTNTTARGTGTISAIISSSTVSLSVHTLTNASAYWYFTFMYEIK